MFTRQTVWLVVEPLEGRRLLSTSVVGLTLIDADTDQPVEGFVLEHGSVIDLAQVGSNLSIRAETTGELGSVRFNYDGDPDHHADNSADFAINGDDAGDFHAWSPTLGTHTLVVTAYAGPDATGQRGGYRAMTFNVIDSSPQRLRVNAGGPAYSATSGKKFAADSGFTGGEIGSTRSGIPGTSDDALYQSYRHGEDFKYSAAVHHGLYTLVLHFSETDFKRPSERTFDVRAEGDLVLNDYDILDDVGRKTAVSKSFDVTVNDGRIDLSFTGVSGPAMVNAIELIPQRVWPADPAPMYINAGGQRFTDSIWRVFQSDGGFVGGLPIQESYDVLNTVDDDIFASYRFGGNFSFSQAVAPGNYSLWLEFAEPSAISAGQRKMDVWAEGQQVLNDYDIYADAGPGTAIAKHFNVQITDGQLDLSFLGVTGEAVVSAIVLVPTDIPEPVLPYTDQLTSSDRLLAAAHETSRVVKSSANLRKIGQLLHLYASENGGRFPADFRILAEYMSDAPHNLFGSPRAGTDLPRGELSRLEQVAWLDAIDDYIYVGASLRAFDPPNSVFAYENPDRTPIAEMLDGTGQYHPGDLLNVLYLDSSVQLVSRADIIAMFGGSLQGPPVPYRPMDLPRDPLIEASGLNLITIGQSLYDYASGNRGFFPPDFGTLYSAIEMDIGTFVNPRGSNEAPPADWTHEQKVDWINASNDYLYTAAGQRTSLFNADELLAFENPAEMNDGANLLLGWGQVDFREMRWVIESMARALVLAGG